MVRLRVIRINGRIECTGSLSNDHGRWIALLKARKASLSLYVTPRLEDRGLNQKTNGCHRPTENYAESKYSGRFVVKIIYSKNEYCINKQGCGPDDQIKKEVRKINKLLYRNRPEECPDNPSIDEPFSIYDKRILNLKILEKSTDSAFEVPSPKPGSLVAPLDKTSFPIKKPDKYLFIVILLGLLCAGIRNLIEGLSEVPRPPGRGF